MIKICHHYIKIYVAFLSNVSTKNTTLSGELNVHKRKMFQDAMMLRLMEITVDQLTKASPICKENVWGEHAR